MMTPFLPSPLIRNSGVQTVLARVPPPGVRGVTCREYPVLLDAGPDRTQMDPTGQARLLGYFNATSLSEKRGLVLMLHGWEGCSHSNYNLIMARALLAAGFDVFRLNLRDHGPGYHIDPHALNPGVFNGTLIDEVAEAVHQVARIAGSGPFFIVGPSMGGNFALRLAVRHSRTPFQSLRHVVAVSPAINPAAATRALDRQPLYRRYFRKRWLRSLATKQALFPDLYGFGTFDDRRSLYDLTDLFVRRLGLFSGADDYFDRYTVHGDALANLAIPTTIIAAANDPIIPVENFSFAKTSSSTPPADSSLGRTRGLCQAVAVSSLSAGYDTRHPHP